MAAQDSEDPGVMVLSPFARAADELDGAVLANPYDSDSIAEALNKGLHMSLKERRERWERMMYRLRRNDIAAWQKNFVRALNIETSITA